MNESIYDYFLWLVTLAVGFYTLTYARWLWRKKNRRGALGTAVLALLAVLYPGFVLFILS
ncbi:MAG: hypothetical protein QHH10_03655 [Peptococcaceae bacterium]|nr:hypothetical protein [Peptococcaceae bacterium]MDH7524394.1 hypothetical protein [Peptococcaceae bacterium]